MMSRWLRRLCAPSLAWIPLILCGAMVFADKWQPYEFSGPARYKYQVRSIGETEPGASSTEVTCTLQILPSKKEGKEGLFQVSFTLETLLSREEVGRRTFMGMPGLLGTSASMTLMNPMFSLAYSQVELRVGEEMDLFGAGTLKVTGRETILGIEGFVCELYTGQGEQLTRSSEAVVHPQLTLPLRSRVYKGGELHLEMLLLEYKKL